MIKRAMLLGLCSLGLFGLAGTVGAQQADKNEERAARVRALQRQLMELDASAQTKVLQERGVKPVPRPAVNSAYNVDTFAPVTARFVRFNVLATVSGDEPCLDALELYGPDSSANLTAATGVRLTASSIWPGHLGDFKDGKYGPGWCWVGTERGKGWVQVELPAPATIARVVWSRDGQNRYQDRFATIYKVEVSDDGHAWQTVATGAGRAAPGPDGRLSSATLVKALDPGQRQKRQELRDELRKLGAPAPGAVQSGPQVGEHISGGFRTLFLNGSEAGKQRCPV